MFKIYFHNFGFPSQETPDTLEKAKQVAKKAGFQSTIYHNDIPVASYCPLSGFKHFKL